MTKPNGRRKLRQTQVRMDDDFKARIRKYQAAVLKKTGLPISFSWAVRSLINQSLEREGIR